MDFDFDTIDEDEVTELGFNRPSKGMTKVERTRGVIASVVAANARLKAEKERLNDDEQAFATREANRFTKDKGKIECVTVGGSFGGGGAGGGQENALGGGFETLAGMEPEIKVLKELALLPLTYPEIFEKLGVPSGRGVLLHGPPGTGKTLIGRAVASQCNATFFSISASSLTSKWIGEGEKMVKALFAVANCCEPAVIFVDEIDSLLSSRKAEGEHESSRRMKTEFLVQMDGLSGDEGRVLMIGATNRPQELDDGARRRLAKQLCTCWGFLKARHAVYRPVRDYLLCTTGNSYQYCGQLTQYHGTLSNPSYKFQTWPEGLTLFVHKNRHSPSLRESAARDDAEHFERGERGGARLERQRPKHDLRENARVFRVRYETPNPRSREGAVAGTVSKQRQGKFAKFAKRQPIAQRHAAHNALGFQARFEASPAERDAGGYRVPRTLEFRARRDEWEGGGRGRGRGVVDFVFFFATTTSTMKLFTFYFKAVTTPAAPL